MSPLVKVLFVLHLPPPVHGASVMGKALYDSVLIKEQFDCRFINLSASENVSEIGKLSIGKIYFLFKSIINLVWIAIRFRPSLCYITPSSWDWGFYRDFILISILKLLGIPVLAHFHNKAPKAWLQKFYNKFLNKWFYSGIKIILLSDELYPEKQPFISKENVFICPNGIEEIKGSDNRNPSKLGEFKFLFLSNMMEEKGVYILLEACKILKDTGSFFECHFIGKWSDVTENDFDNYVIEQGLAGFVFAYGSKYGQEKISFFENADVFVFPTFYHGETFGLVLLEAMQFGLPCISTKEGGIPSVVKDLETGFLVEPRNAVELAAKMKLFISEPDLVRRMGDAGRVRFGEKFTLKIFESRFVDILKQTLKKKI